MINKKQSRIRRARKTRAKIREKRAIRLSVHRTPKHIYAQIISEDGANILVTASSCEKELRAFPTGNVDSATKVGVLIAERAKAAGIESVAFDRSGFGYKGRVAALADAARESGLQF
ncbi:MAG: 50S ribosomal protein L18 [Pseudomonadales bacterium]|nr:50S ribosomal protein L18 [Pseudomonadales bacterium]